MPSLAAVQQEQIERMSADIANLLDERDKEWATAAAAAGQCDESVDGAEGPHLGVYGYDLHPECGCKDLRRLMAEAGWIDRDDS